MGEAVWEFMWFIDKITRIDEKGFGWVLNGKPINLKDLADDLGVQPNTVSRNIQKLKKEGYLVINRTPYGLGIRVCKAKKRFNKNGTRFIISGTRFNRNGESNIRHNNDSIKDITSNSSKRIHEYGFKRISETMKT